MEEMKKQQQLNRLFYLSLCVISAYVFLLLGNNGYVLFDDSNDYMNTFYREGLMPIYPLFLMGNRALFGEAHYLQFVTVEQALLASVCVIYFVHVVRKQFDVPYLFGYFIYALALIPFTLEMPTAMLTHVILTEGLTYALFYVFAAFCLKAVWEKSFRWLAVGYVFVYLMSLIRSQLEILFGVCGVLFFYILLWKKTKKNLLAVKIVVGAIGCVILALLGVMLNIRTNGAYHKFILSFSEYEAAKTGHTVAPESQQEAGDKSAPVATSQYATLLFSRGMYEAEYEDAELFDGELKELYLHFYQVAEEKQCTYAYATPGLWMWKDISGGIGQVGMSCFQAQKDFYAEKNPDLIRSPFRYQSQSNQNYTTIGLTLLKAHFGRFLFHTIMMLPQAFICTVFFQIAPIYLLCHLFTLFMYVTAVALMIWAFVCKEADKKCAEFMALILGTNVVMIVIISIVFFGMQRYLLYTFGLFYIAYLLLLLQLWKQYGSRIMEIVSQWKKNKKS